MSAPTQGRCPDARAVLILRAILEAPTRGPLHMCERLSRRNDMRPILECFEELHRRELIVAPVESGTDFWTVSPAGRSFLEAHESDASGPLIRGVVT